MSPASRVARSNSQDWVELVELVRNTTDMHRRQMLHNRLQFEVRLPERPLWVHADATRLSQVVGNLLMNALKFTDPGGQVTTRLETSGDQATISVKDTGIGMDVEMLQRVFEPLRKPITASTAAAVAWAWDSRWSGDWSSGTGEESRHTATVWDAVPSFGCDCRWPHSRPARWLP